MYFLSIKEKQHLIKENNKTLRGNTQGNVWCTYNYIGFETIFADDTT